MNMKQEIEQIHRQTVQVRNVRKAINPVRFLLDKCIEYINDQAFRIPKKVDFKNGRPVVIEDGDPLYNTEETFLIKTYEELTGEKVNAVS